MAFGKLWELTTNRGSLRHLDWIKKKEAKQLMDGVLYVKQAEKLVKAFFGDQ